LDKLQIEGAFFEFLPDSIGSLQSLTRLYLYRTAIKTIPKTICNLQKLEKIRLLRCIELKELPESIGNIKTLQTLYIRGGKFTTLPDSIGNLQSLISIQLQYTNIASLPDSIRNLGKLENLGIYGSQTNLLWSSLDSFPDYYQDEATEKRSPFNKLPDSVSNLHSLKKIKLNNSEVTELPDFLSHLPLLERIEITDCNIKKIPPSIQKLIDTGDITIIKNDYESWQNQHFFGRKNIKQLSKPLKVWIPIQRKKC
jgi:Leucine-rich repeat (LRR) protein